MDELCVKYKPFGEGIKLRDLISDHIKWEGWVYKRRNLIRKKRYFVLSISHPKEIQIYYFASSVKKAKALGLIPLTQQSSIEKKDFKKNNGNSNNHI